MVTWASRARRIELVLTDCDGVLTDNGVYYSERGEEMKRFSIRDGKGVERLKDAGVATGIVTGERSPSILRRAEKLGIEIVRLGVKDKLADFKKLLEETKLDVRSIAFIGDDVNDLPLLRHVGEHGLTGAPRDAMREVFDEVHHPSSEVGGHGAFREFAEWILRLRAERKDS